MATQSSSDVLLVLMALIADLPEGQATTEVRNGFNSLLQSNRSGRAATVTQRDKLQSELQSVREQLASVQGQACGLQRDAKATAELVELRVEHDDVVKQLAAVKLERDAAVTESAKARKQCDEQMRKLYASEDEATRLRQEVARLEERAKKQSTLRSRVAPTQEGVGSRKNSSSALSLVEKAFATVLPTSASTSPKSNMSVEPQEDSRPHASGLGDPRRPSLPTDPMQTMRPPPPKQGDSYRPGDIAALGQKRRRSSASPLLPRKQSRVRPPTPKDTSALATSTSTRTAVCGTCAGQDLHYVCDGKALCGRCETFGFRMCVYHECMEGMDCYRREKCDYLHPDQYDREGEQDRRIVKAYGAKRDEFVGAPR